MHINILPANETSFCGASIDAQVLLRSVRSCILQESDSSLVCARFVGVDWKNVRNISIHNRLGVLMLRGLVRNAAEIPVHHRFAMEQHQLDAVRMNAVNLMTLRDVIPKLESSGVKVIVLKGPVAQKIVHGDFFSKPSTDVDLLVSPNEYDLASKLIADNGFALAEECSSPWWSVFLGEQHFISSTPLRSTVDLHYRTQQPGSPIPRESRWFVSRPISVWAGGIQVRTLSQTNACLLSCMSVSKALIHREPAGGYVSDIAAIIKSRPPDELERLFEDACGQGLRNTLLLGLRSAFLLFGVEVRFDGGADEKVFADEAILKSISDADLLTMILSPTSPKIRWPRRSKILWDLCDDKTAYPRAISWKVGADLCRQVYQSRV